MIFATLKAHKYLTAVIAIIIALVVYKLPVLKLPYFWDEAWPYSVAVHTLYHNGLSLLPDAIPPELSRGHPLLFHFLSAGWMNVFGTQTAAVHAFSLFVGALLILMVYQFCRAFFSARIGMVSCLLLATQGAFVAQSAFLLPEVLLSLWSMLCLYLFFKRQYVQYVLAGTAMLLTKESGAILVLSLAIVQLFTAIKVRKRALPLLAQLCVTGMPLLLAGGYFIIQKMTYGWFFFPYHLSLIEINTNTWTEKLPQAAAYIFVYSGRNIFSLLILSSCVVLAVRKRALTIIEKNMIAVTVLFLVLFLVFSAVNFFIPRYLLCLFPLVIISGTLLADKALAHLKVIYPLIIAVLVAINISYWTHDKQNGTGYDASINTALQMVRYCEANGLQDKPIFTTAVMRIDFNEPYAGYLTGKKFSNIQWEFSADTEYCIFSKDEYDGPLFDKLMQEHKLVLVKKYEDRYAWCALYRVGAH